MGAPCFGGWAGVHVLTTAVAPRLAVAGSVRHGADAYSRPLGSQPPRQLDSHRKGPVGYGFGAIRQRRAILPRTAHRNIALRANLQPSRPDLPAGRAGSVTWSAALEERAGARSVRLQPHREGRQDRLARSFSAPGSSLKPYSLARARPDCFPASALSAPFGRPERRPGAAGRPLAFATADLDVAPGIGPGWRPSGCRSSSQSRTSNRP